VVSCIPVPLLGGGVGIIVPVVKYRNIAHVQCSLHRITLFCGSVNTLYKICLCDMHRAAQLNREVHGPVEVKLLCGADVLESFGIPGVWKPEHVR